MFRHIAVSLAIILSSVSPLLLSKEAIAETALTRAVVESLRNQVRLMRQNQSARPARPSDTMTPGDALATASASMAQLRFNDGSLARLGQQVVFKFVPGSRSFRLSNGTALLLIPPGQGRTNVRTPNAAAGIRGSALFVRYNPETDTTIVGALTNSGIEVFNQTASQRQELKAGYMAVIVKDRIEQVYEFDLNNFYRTSELVRGLNLTKRESTPSPDEAIASVQAETAQALQEQSQFTSEQVIENPSFVQLPPSTSGNFPDLDPSDDPVSSGVQNSGSFKDAEDIRLLLQGQDIRDTLSSPRTDSDNPNNPTDRNNTNNGSNRDNPSNPTDGNATNNGSNRDNQRNPNNRNTNNNGRNRDSTTNPTDRNNLTNRSNRDNQRNPNNRNTNNNGRNGNNPSNPTDGNTTNNGNNRDNQRNPNDRNTNNNGRNGNNPSNPTDGNATNDRSNRDNQRNPNNRNTTNNGRNGNNPSNPTDGNTTNDRSNRDNQRNPNDRNTTNNGNNRDNQSNPTDGNNSNNRSNRDNQRNPNDRNTTNNGNNRDN